MPISIENIAAQAMKLPPDERADLADRLWLSVHMQEETDAAWDAEIQQRIAQIDAGQAEFIPWEMVVAQQRERLNKRAG